MALAILSLAEGVAATPNEPQLAAEEVLGWISKPLSSVAYDLFGIISVALPSLHLLCEKVFSKEIAVCIDSGARDDEHAVVSAEGAAAFKAVPGGEVETLASAVMPFALTHLRHLALRRSERGQVTEVEKFSDDVVAAALAKFDQFIGKVLKKEMKFLTITCYMQDVKNHSKFADSMTQPLRFEFDTDVHTFY
uniref:Uncharacterized protein n=1 Tax=Glossina pallidipes TaxID=7398 RepID=A0A1B0AGP1_GLOPL